MTYSIRLVDGSDRKIAKTIKRLHKKCFGDTAPQATPESGFWWLGHMGSEPVCFASLSPSEGVANAGYLSRSGVLDGHRGQRLQLRMIRLREAKARSLGWTHMRCDTTCNPRSSNSLIRAGYKLFTPSILWAFDHSLYWRKDL